MTIKEKQHHQINQNHFGQTGEVLEKTKGYRTKRELAIQYFIAEYRENVNPTEREYLRYAIELMGGKIIE